MYVYSYCNALSARFFAVDRALNSYFMIMIMTWVGPRKRVLGAGAQWRHLANTSEPSMFDGNAAFCQITLTTCYLFHTPTG